jgi:hypothetical protein
MLIPFDGCKSRSRRNTAPVSNPDLDCSVDWRDGSYLVGVLDGTLVGVTPLSSGLCLVDPTDAADVLTMLREYLPASVRAAVRSELIAEETGLPAALRVVK